MIPLSPPLTSPLLRSAPSPSLSFRFQPLVPDPDGDNIWSYENAAMFLFSNFQYLTLALVLSSGPPYRKPTYCNREQHTHRHSRHGQGALCPAPRPTPPLQCT